MALGDNSQQIGNLNSIASLASQLIQFQAAYAALNSAITEQVGGQAQALWSQLATCAQNADGTLGAADASPNTAHPINPNAASGAGLSRAKSETAYSQAFTALGTINTAINGQLQILQALVGT
jgi:hypothetical protein